jgi:hypothetical protein
MRHDPAVAASPPVRDMLGVEGVSSALPRLVRGELEDEAGRLEAFLAA